MDSDFGAVHDELRGVARMMLANHSPLTTAGRSFKPLDWQLLASSGWLGLEVPAAQGGAGAGFAELAVLLTEFGRVAAAAPYLGSVVLGTAALSLLEANTGRDHRLQELAAGTRRVAVALPTDRPEVGQPTAPFRIRRAGSVLEVSGRAGFVPDVVGADEILLLAADDHRPVLVAVAPSAPGLQIDAQPVVDETRHLAAVIADGVEIDPDSLWSFTGSPEAGAARLAERAMLAVACDSLGLATMMMEATVAYVTDRYQFGRPIGSYQAVKHACADMLVGISICSELVGTAVEALSSDEPGSWVPVSMAKAHVSSVAVEIAGKAIQLHGGVGYTWERGLHAYLKRAALNRSLFGSPIAHRRRLAARYAGEGNS